MDLPFVGVQGHQKPLENTETLMKIDVFLCLVVQEPGFYQPPRYPGFCTTRPTKKVDFHKGFHVFQWFWMFLTTYKRQVHLGVCCGGV